MTGRVELEGEVCSGLAEASRFTALDWVMREFADKLGLVPHPGTFNLRISDPRWPALRSELARRAGIALTPPPGFCGAKCFPAVLADAIEAAVVLPEVAGYPDDKLELVAPVSVRSVLKLDDGDTVRLTIRLDGERKE